MGSPPYRVKAVFDYTSPHEDDLKFSLGQIITVTDEEDADWYYGEFEQDGLKKQGLFPRNFVERYEPTTPPRPSRPSRAKKEPEDSHQTQGTRKEEPIVEPPAVADLDDQSHANPALETPAPAAGLGIQSGGGEIQYGQSHKSTSVETSPPPVVPPVVGTLPVEKKSDGAASPKSLPGSPPAQTPAAGSFRDRIAAFNKPSAPPVAPKKPGNLGKSGSSGFVKKPYVAPPPSRNAYVPPPPKDNGYTVIKRGSDAESTGYAQTQAEEQPSVASAEKAPELSEEQQKPTKLKDRIALLQQQQLEQAARHAEAAQRKEKPKKPPRKSSNQQSEALGPNPNAEEGMAEGTPSQNEAEDTHHVTKPTKRRSEAENEQGIAATSVPRELPSDTHDADRSAGGDTTEAGGEIDSPHTAALLRQDEDEQPSATPEAEHDKPLPGQSQANVKDPPVAEDEDQADEDEEEDLDPEIKRRMELRDRMAKMSGGMGMAGMFGPGGGLPGMAPKKPQRNSSRSAEPSAESHNAEADWEARQPVPMIPMPGMSLPVRSKVQSPESEDGPTSSAAATSLPAEPEAAKSGNETDSADEFENAENPSDDVAGDPRDAPLKSLSGRPVPAPSIPEYSGHQPASPEPERGAPPPPPPNSRPVPAPPVPSTRPAPSRPESKGTDLPIRDEATEEEHADAPLTYSRARPVPPTASVGHSTQLAGPRSTESSDVDTADSSADPRSSATRSAPRQPGRAPPVPGSISTVTAPPQSRAPPPPPPAQGPPSRRSTGHRQSSGSGHALHAESREEITGYDGDYDTDMASGVLPKDAWRARGRTPSGDETLAEDDPTLHHAGLPSIGPSTARPPIPSSAAPRAVPPPPPTQPPKRQSTDMPRAAPPPPPPKQEPLSPREEIEKAFAASPPLAPFQSREPDLARTLSPNSREPLSAYQPPSFGDGDGTADQAPSPNLPPPGPPRRSLDVPVAAGSSRRSTEAPRVSSEQGHIAQDIDLGRATQWWMQRKMPPPVFQSRSDIVFEVEEAASQALTMKHVYVLFTDYSQTVVTARYEETNPAQVELSQRHDGPPPRLRQDQLEDVHARFGMRLADAAAGKANAVVGNGTAQALVMELLAAFPDALPPVGARAFGALVYANMANATVVQHDEIRPGDVVTFRNARLQGHKGTLKRYSVDVGKPDHVGIVVDWDGTKKKVRAWEQGRESKKVKMESFRLGDLSRGEIKVWRVVARDWVGWGR